MGTSTSGNFTEGVGSRRKGLQGNSGGVLGHLKNLTADQAQKVKNQYDAEATYSDWANHQAMGDLSLLHQNLSNLSESFGSLSPRDRIVRQNSVNNITSKAKTAFDTANRAGFVAHPDIIGNNGHINGVLKDLNDLDTSDYSPQAKLHHEASINSAQQLLDRFNAVRVTTTKNQGKIEHGDSSKFGLKFSSPEYEQNINVESAENARKAKRAVSPDAWDAKERKRKNEANRTPEQLAAKAAKRKETQQMKKAALAAQAKAAQ